MPPDLSQLERFLSDLRRRSAWLLVAELLATWTAIALFGALIAAGLGALSLTGPALQSLFWLGLFGLPLVLLVRRLLPRHLRLSTPAGAAREVDHLRPELGTRLSTALELGEAARSGATHGQSSELIGQVVKDAQRQLADLAPAELVPADRVRRSLRAAAASVLAMALALTFAREQLTSGLQTFLKRPAELVTAALAKIDEDSGPPLGDITLVLNFPAYLDRPPQTLENATGEVRAPLGTTVAITARTSQRAESAQLVVDGQEPIAATVDSRGRLTGAFTVTREGGYRFLLMDSGDQTPTRRYAVVVEEDAIPTIELIGPEDTLEIAATDSLPLAWRARDDHGVTEISVAISSAGKQELRALAQIPAGKDSHDGEAVWYPAEWNLPQGSQVDLWLEVKDNDTVSGPKIGRSRVIRVQIASDEGRHARTLEMKEALKEALLAVLGDQLVWGATATDRKTLDVVDVEHKQGTLGMSGVVDGFRALRDSMEGDALEERSVYAALLATEQDVLKGWQSLDATMTTALSEGRGSVLAGSRITGPRARDIDKQRQVLVVAVERAILSMESFANLQRLDKILETGDQMRTAADQLRAAMEEFSKGGDSQDLKALLTQIDQMEQKLGQMAQQLSELDQSSAEWFQNPTGQTQEAVSALEQVRELLRQGKKEEAMKAMQEYMANLEEMMANLEEMKSQEFGEVREQASRDIGQAIENLKQLEKDQGRLAGDTEAHTRMIQQQAGLSPEALKKELSELAARARKIQEGVEKATRAAGTDADGTLLERQLRSMSGAADMLEAALQAGQLGESLQRTREVGGAAAQAQVDGGRRLPEGSQGEFQAGMSQARREAAALEADLSELASRMARMQAQAAAQGQGLAQRQQRLQGQGQGLGQELSEFSRGSPMVPREWGEQMNQAMRVMDSAQQKLEGGEMQGAAADQRAAEGALRALREQMEAQRDSMMQQQRGVPRPGGPQPGEQNLAQGQRPGGEGPGRTETEQWGRGDPSRGEIEVIQAGKGSEQWRKDLVEGMKGESPERYRGQVHDYYEKLVE